MVKMTGKVKGCAVRRERLQVDRLFLSRQCEACIMNVVFVVVLVVVVDATFSLVTVRSV